MWRVISLLLLLLVLAGFSFADTIPSTPSPTSSILVDSNNANPGNVSQQAARYPQCYEHKMTNPATRPPLSPGVSTPYFLECPGGIAGPLFLYSAGFDCPNGYVLSADPKLCNKVERPVCSASTIAARCAAWKGTGVMATDIPNTAVCAHASAPASMPDDCDPPPGVGCSMTARFNPLGPPQSMDYTGQSCNVTATSSDPSGQQTDPIPALPQPLPQSPGNCKPDEYFGTVSANGKTLQGCFGSGPVPSSNAPLADPSTGKDSNGNCAANYIGRINSSGALECFPNTQPDQNANCPTGWTKISTGQQTVCVDPNSKPGGPANSGGSGGSGGNSNNPGTGASSPSNSGSPNASGTEQQDPGKCTGMPDWVCNLGSGLSGPDGGSPSGSASSGGDISSMLDTSDFFGGGACPSPKVVVVPLYITEWNWTIDYSPFCDIVARLRPAVIACGFLVAGAIILKR